LAVPTRSWGSVTSRRTATGRHPADVLRLGFGLLILVWATFAAASIEHSRLDVNLFRLINQLPDAAGPPLIGVMQLGALGAVPVIAIVCVLARRLRLARLVALGGAAAWLLAKVLSSTVAERPPDERIVGVVLHGALTPGLSFPATHVAVAAAMATVASPYLGRSGRRSIWLLVGIVAIARVYVGIHFPVDVIGGFAVGWVVGSTIHLCVGAPRGSPDPHALAARLREHGIAALGAVPLTRDGSTFRVETEDGHPLHVRVVDRDSREADWLYRAWRMVAFRDTGEDRGPRSSDHTVEHEALAFALASRCNVPVPDVLWTARLTEGESVLVRKWVPGKGLAEVVQAVPSALGAAWQALELLHGGGLAHGSANVGGFVVTSDGIACIEFTQARLHANAVDRRHDVAELLASSSAVIGPAAAISCARENIGADALVDALAALQPLVLSGPTRGLLRARRGTLDELRSQLAELGGLSTRPSERPVWIAGRNLAPLALGTVALVLLLSQAGNFQVALHAARHANPVWVSVAVVSAGFTYIMAAIALMGASPQPLALGRTTLVQLASTFTNRLAPAGLGALATNIRYLEHAGLRRSRAATTLGVDAAAGFIVHLVLLATLIPLVGVRTHLKLPRAPDFDVYWPVVVFIIGSLSIAGVWYWRHRLRAVIDRIRPHARDLRSVLEHPARSVMLFGGSAGITAAQAFVLVACLEAVGVHLAVLTVLAVFVVGSAVAAAAPTPGGLGALEAALVAGLAQVGVLTTRAVAAVLMSRIIGYWLPVLPGWIAFTAATRDGTL